MMGTGINLEHALPLLEKYDARATLYLVWDREIDWAPQKKAHHNSGELLTEPKLSDEEVTQLVRSGRFEIGGHTLTHLNMVKSAPDTKRRELTDRNNGSSRCFRHRFGRLPIRLDSTPRTMSSWSGKPVTRAL